MSRRNNEFRIGAMVLSFSVVVIWLIVLFGKQSFPNFGEEYPLIVKFSGISGIDKNTPVNRNGVKIGRVDSIEPFDGAEESYVLVKIMIRKDRQVFTNDECRINTAMIGVGSNTFLEIAKRHDYDKEAPVFEMKPGEEMPGVVPPNLMQSFVNIEKNFTSAVKNFNSASQKVETFVNTLNSVVGTPESAVESHEKLHAMLLKSSETIGRIDELVSNINKLFGDEKMRTDLQKAAGELPGLIDALAKDLPTVTKTLADDLPEISKMFKDKLPPVVDELPSTISQIRSVAKNLDILTDEARVALNRITSTVEVARTNLESMETFSTALEEDGPEILKATRHASQKLEGVFNDITMLTTALSNPDGSLGQLINNPELYQNVQHTIANGEEISASLKPIISDLRIFMDKIARDPGGELGVRGALRKSTPGKGLPSISSRTKYRSVGEQFYEGNRESVIDPTAFPMFDSDFDSKFNVEFGAIYGTRNDPRLSSGNTMRHQRRFAPEYGSQLVALESGVWHYEDQPRKNRFAFPSFSKKDFHSHHGTTGNPFSGFRSKKQTPGSKTFRLDFWNKNEPAPFAADHYFTNDVQSQILEPQVRQPRKLTPRPVAPLSRAQKRTQQNITQVQYRATSGKNPAIAQQQYTQPQYVQAMESQFDGLSNHTSSPVADSSYGYASSPGPAYGQQFSGMVHEGEQALDGLIHQGQHQYEGAMHGGEYLNENFAHEGRLFGNQGMDTGIIYYHDPLQEMLPGETSFGGSTFAASRGFGTPFSCGSSFFEEMKFRGLIFKENLKNFFYSLRYRFSSFGGGFNTFDSFGTRWGTIETNQNGLVSYLMNGNGSYTDTASPSVWGKSDAYPLSHSSNPLLTGEHDFLYEQENMSSYGSPYHVGGTARPIPDFSTPGFDQSNMLYDNMLHDNYVPHDSRNGFSVPGGSSSRYYDSPGILPEAGDSGAMPHPDPRPGPPGNGQKTRPTTAPVPDLDDPRNQHIQTDETPHEEEEPQTDPYENGLMPPLGNQRNGNEEVPPTLLEFGEPDDSEPQSESDAENGVGSGDFRYWGKTFPTKNRGYIIELETDVPQLASRPTPQESTRSTAASSATEIHLSFTAPPLEQKRTPASMVSQASLQSSKLLNTAHDSQESTQEQTIFKPKPTAPRQYGSVRRGITP